MSDSSTRARRRLRGVAAVLAVASVVRPTFGVLHAQVTREGNLDALHVAGSWKPVEMTSERGASAAEMRGMEAHLRAILAVLRQPPLVEKPVGFTVYPKLHILPGEGFGPASPAARGLPLEGSATLDGIQHTIEKGRVRLDDGYTSGFTLLHVRVNEPSSVFYDEADDTDHEWADSIGRMHTEPRRGEDYKGYPTYMTSAGERRVIITNRSVPIFIPVERERVLRLFLAQDRAALANSNGHAAGNDPTADYVRNLEASRKGASREQVAMIDAVVARYKATLKEMAPQFDSIQRANTSLLAAHERLLAKMTPAERRAPAVFAPGVGRFADNPFAPGNGGVQLFQLNPAFFDSSLPRSQIQLIAFDVYDQTPGQAPRLAKYQPTFLEQLDLKALAALVR